MSAATILVVGLTASLYVGAAQTARRLDQAMGEALRLRTALLVKPAQARAMACRRDVRRRCSVLLSVRADEGWVSACGLTPRSPEPARYYRVEMICQIWPSLPRRRLLDLVIFR